MKHLNGIVTAMVTPVDKSGKINTDATAKLTQYLIDSGVTGLFPLGTNGECMRFNVEERKKVAETIVSTARGSNTSVFVHTGAMTEEDTAELTKHAYSIRADGAGIVTPPYFKLNDNELFNFYKRISEVVPNDFPIYVYNIPQCSGNDISYELMCRLFDKIPNIIGIKYSFNNDERTRRYCSIEGLSVLHGADTRYPEMMEIGCDGVVSGLSGAYPKPFVEQASEYSKGNKEAMFRWQKIAKEVAKVSANGNIAYIKFMITERGIDVGEIKLPAFPPLSEEQNIIKSGMKNIDAEIKQLNMHNLVKR